MSATSSRSRPSSFARAATRTSRRSLRSTALDDGEAGCVHRVGGQLGLAAAAPQLVERRVAGDPEQPGAAAAPLRVEAGALAVGALEGGGGDVLGRGAVAKQAGGVGVDVVAAGAVELLEGEVRLARGVRSRFDKSLTHALTTGEAGIRHRLESGRLGHLRRLGAGRRRRGSTRR